MAVLDSTIINGDLSVSGDVQATNFYSTSDKRLKENIKDLGLDCTKFVSDIQLKEFNYIADEEKKTVIGAIAQEVKEILPEEYKDRIVVGDDLGVYMINEPKLAFIAIGAIKDLIKKNEELERRIAELEAKE